MSYKNFVIAITLILVLVTIYYTHRPWLNLTSISAGPDNAKWNVLEYKNKREAAELLSRVNSRMIEFMRTLKQKYHIDEPDDIAAAEGSTHQKIINSPGDIYNMVDHLLDDYNPEVFYETDARITTDTSYTLDKGRAMYICLRSKPNFNKLVDENTLIFCMVHEMSHIANYRGWGHDTQFWIVFKWLLHESVLAGAYTPVDYSKYPVNYCGLDVSYSPLYDDSLINLWE